MALCENCGTKLKGGEKFCPHCGTKMIYDGADTSKGGIKGALIGLLAWVGLTCGFVYACDSCTDKYFGSKTDKVTREEVPTQMETVSVKQMLDDLRQNEIRAQKEYAGKWFEIIGRLGSMDSEGEYFSLDSDAFSLKSIRCNIPNDKRDELTNKLTEMEKGDRIAVKGKVTDMGEIMGSKVKHKLLIAALLRIKLC